MLAKDSFSETLSFIDSREQNEGGFSFANVAPSTLEDTYYAIRTIDTISNLVRKKIEISDETIDYIRNASKTDLKDYKWLFRYAWLYKKVGLEYPELKEKRLSKDLNEIFYYLSIYRLLGKKPQIDEEIMKYLNDLGFKKPQYVQESSMFVHIAKQLGIDFNEETFRKFILESQGCDGGFGFCPGTTSFLENTFFAVKMIDEMNIRPLAFDLCEEFILSCKANNGGYGRQLTTVPSLEASYHAIKSLIIIDKWKSIK